MHYSEITPLVLTFNEEANLERTLERLTWAKRIVIVDSFSTDRTLAICTEHPQVEVVQRTFDTHAEQWNFGLTQVRSDWVLALDADYVLTEELIAELGTVTASAGTDAYVARFKYFVFGRALRGSLYPPRPVLFRRSKARYQQHGHSQDLVVSGATGSLAGWVWHDDRKPLDRWFEDQLRYSAQEADLLLSTPRAALNVPDKVRKLGFLAPLGVLLYALIWRGAILDGPRGWYYAFQRALNELLLSIRLIDRRLRSEKDVDTHD